MPGPDDKDELVTTPPKREGQPTPGGSSDPALTADQGARPSPLPAVSARYEILGELGRGGMGVVYRARDRETGDLVALKALRAEIAANPAVLERFKGELLLARKITHKNICRTYELLRFGDTVVIAMEYVEGRSLRSYLEAGAGVAASRGLDWAGQICDGLREAHAQGVVHRDLKPENILIDNRGQVKVMDFGIARSLEPDATQTGNVIGTPAYMAPEQAEGKAVDQRTDIYSLGLIFYEMFTGRQALTAETPLALVHKQVHDTPAAPRSVERFLPDFLERAIEKCLEKNPARRFQSVAELEAALTEQTGGTPVAGDLAEVELPARLTAWQRSDWLLLAASIAGAVLFLYSFLLTNLASRTKVTFDRSVLRRTAEDYARRLGAPIGEERQTYVRGYPYRYDYIADNSGPSTALGVFNDHFSPWGWAVEWENRLDGSDITVVIDNGGSLTGFVREFPSKGIPSHASLEEARPLGEKAIREFFNCDPAKLQLASAGAVLHQGVPATQFQWEASKGLLGLKERCTVTLVGTEIQTLAHFYDTPAGYKWWRPPFAWTVYSMIGILLLLLVLGLSEVRRVNPFAPWRVIVTGTSFLLGGWFIRMEEGAPLPGMAALGLVFALASFFGSMTLERTFSKVAPARLASFLRLFDRRVASEPCGLALLRGALVGVTLLGVEGFLIWLLTPSLGIRADVYYHIENQASMLNRWWPGGQILIYSLFQGLGTGFVISFLASIALRFTRRTWVVVLLTAALAAAGDIHWSLGRIQPNHWMVALLFIEYLILVWALLRYDILTLCAAVFTFTLCLENWSIASMLSPVGAPGEWLAFGIWGLLVALAALAAARSAVRRAYRRVAAAFA